MQPVRVVTAILLVLTGLFCAVLGGRLALLGGSFFYLLFGLGLVATAMLAGRGRSLFAAILAATAIWAVWESGLDFWALEVRLAAPVVIGLWLLLVWPRPGRVPLSLAVAASLLLLGAGWLAAPPSEIRNSRPVASTASPFGGAAADWPLYGGGEDSGRYSSLDQITPANVGKLQVAWTLRTGDHKPKATFESPALKIGDTLYLCSGSAWVFALDPVTGAVKWRFIPSGRSVRVTACRGVTHAVMEAVPQGAACRTRIYAPAPNARIVALDAETGKPCEGFGDHGYLDLKTGLGANPVRLVGLSSPPLYMKGRIVSGLYVSDNVHDREPSGAVRAFDAITGALAWSWDVGRMPSNKPLAAGETWTPGTPNVWGVITGDEKLGLAFLPTGNPTPDYFGGQRRAFDDRYNSALVAVDIETGLERWRFQTVHHDLWDMDIPIGPSLVDWRGTPALLQTTKRGEVFILDRATGKPLSEVIEKPAPRGDIAGERYSRTQPWSVGMQSLAPAPIRESDSWGATLFDQLACRIEYRTLRHDGPMTPPSLQGSLVFPAFFGLSDWGGAAVDAGRQIAFLNLNYLPWVVRMTPREQAIAQGMVPRWEGKGPLPPDAAFGIQAQYLTPYAARIHAWLNPLGVPCLKPPLGEMAALDLKAGKILWKRSYGTTRHSGPFGLDSPVPLPTGIYTVGAPMATAGGVVFMAGGIDRAFRALDAGTGDTLWSADLPAPGAATPTTYLGRDGRQYVVIAAGGHWAMGKAASDQMIAYALPR